MGPFIKMREGVLFNGNGDVLVTKGALAFSSEIVGDAVKLALSHVNDYHLTQAACGGRGPFSVCGDLEFEEYLVLKSKFEEEERIEAASIQAKKKHTSIRRREFSKLRSDLYLAMIDFGIPHICFYERCNEVEDLTIDHIVPLSRGGTDDVLNLQFACKRHNSAKGDKMDLNNSRDAQFHSR
ncbi:HNH endonuclease [Hyphococcus sp.]|jgi:5-methylcytosine-specific restriction endonuclease McrA|uniref:HNH endonuclease n=1 Tax=Hyphococcus sp. TaxID=2038636 RepID=UPI003D11A004